MPSASDYDDFFANARVNAEGAEAAARSTYNKGVRQLAANGAEHERKELRKSERYLYFSQEVRQADVCGRVAWGTVHG